MPNDTPVPGQVRAAGVLVGLQGLTGLGFVVALVVRVIAGTDAPGDVLGEAAYFTILAGGVTLVGAGLLRGKRWGRSPAIVVQILLLGVAWYITGPSGRLFIGLPLGIICLAVIVLLLGGAARTWAIGATEQ